MLPVQPILDASRGRLHREPAVALAALVAVLNLSVMGGRLGGRINPSRGDVLAWRAPMSPITGPASEAQASSETPSNPTRSYNAGQLALNVGIAVVALAAWLHVMRINGARGK